MKLGSRLDRGQFRPRPLVGAIEQIDAYSRIVGAPLVKGNNDRWGDCVETAAYNAIQDDMADIGDLGALHDDLPVHLYSQLTGFDPATGANDNGTDPLSLIKFWQGNSISGWRLASVTHIDPSREGDIRHSIATKGGIYLVVNLSVDQQNQQTWMPTGQPGSWGEHAVWCDSFDGATYFVTSWGLRIAVDRSFITNRNFVVGAFSLDLVRA